MPVNLLLFNAKLEAASDRTSEEPELYEVEDGTEGKLLWSEYIDKGVNTLDSPKDVTLFNINKLASENDGSGSCVSVKPWIDLTVVLEF